MRRVSKGSPLWEYLQTCGVLENGNDIEIKAAKKKYRKNYLLSYKQQQRKAKPGFTVMLSKENGDYDNISVAAKKHSLPVPTFLKEAALAYIHQYYIVPDKVQLARLEQLLAEYLNEVKRIAPVKDKHYWEHEQQYEAIEKRIVVLQMHIREVLSNPPLLSKNDSENIVT